MSKIRHNLLLFIFFFVPCSGDEEASQGIIYEIHSQSSDWIKQFSNGETTSLLNTFEFPTGLSSEEIAAEKDQLGLLIQLLRDSLGEIDSISTRAELISFDYVFGFGPGSENWIINTDNSIEFNYSIKTRNYNWVAIKFVYQTESIQQKLIRKVVLGVSKSEEFKIKEIERNILIGFTEREISDQEEK